MTTELLAPPNVQLAKLTQQIRQAVDLLGRRDRETSAIINHLRVNVVKWIDGQVAARNVATKRIAYESLADICKQKTSTVIHWYECGLVLLDLKLDPESADSTSINYLRKARHVVSKAELLRATQMIRDKEPARKVLHVLQTAKYVAKAGSSPRLRLLAKEGKLTKTSLKMELLAIQTAARKLFNREDISVVIIGGDFRTLLGVGEQAV